ncbi:hypothetical protein HNR46_000889 [Haloferula luteola]|uniref:Plasmid mobilization relaxosome protein MobC n=1 Tax=Haloferula luteola TaxID=595692 RepID=A0A840VCT4_9BACT|nr:plasmid mobilization relaxosome protein MobC [Haloferula luteola]MBB5350661.1 hypothetical protein [Haloferula luteola]
MARPTLSSDRHRLHRIVFRLTDGEHRDLARRAKQLDRRANELARMLLLSALETPGQETSYYDPAVVSELNAIGNNLNQITKGMHITGRLSPTVTALCQRIEDLIDEAIGKENE